MQPRIILGNKKNLDKAYQGDVYIKATYKIN